MSQKSGSSLRVALEVNVHANGSRFQLNGESNGVPGSGEISASVNSKDALPKGFQLPLLSYVLLTGQPVMSRATEGTVNPFEETGGVYHAVRTLDLGERGRLVTTYRVDRANGGLAATFNIDGFVDTPELKSIEPTIETWVPRGGGHIEGDFVMIWRTEKGEAVKGSATTQYNLTSQTSLPNVQFRSIQIDVRSEGSTLKQSEQIVLFGRKGIEKITRS